MRQGIPTVTGPDDSRRWPPRMALIAPLLAIVMPVSVARRLDHVPVIAAWAAHLGGLAILGLVELTLIHWQRLAHDQTLLDAIVLLPAFTYQTLSHAISLAQDPYRGGAFIWQMVASFAAIELGLVIWAWLGLSWAARAEPWKHTFRRTLVRSWLVTSHASVYIGLFVGGVWYIANPRPFHGSWYDGPDLLIAMVGLVLAMAGLFMALWVVSAGNWGGQCRWPGCCESCGYVLLGLGYDQRCPECGKLIDESLGANARPGIRQRPGTPASESTRGRPPIQVAAGRLIGDYFRLGALAIARPTTLGQRARLLSANRLHWGFMPITLVLVGVIAAAFVVGLRCLFAWVNPGTTQSLVDLAFPIVALLCLVWPTAVGLTLGGASFSASLGRRGTGRNLLPIARQAAACLGLYIAGATAVLAVYGLASIVIEVRLGLERNPVEVLGGFTLIELLSYGVVLLGASLLCGYLALVSRITLAGRYANR